MGFAKYFNRDIIALNKRLSPDAENNFNSILQARLVGIEFDEQVRDSLEASTCIELLIRILSRFYPKLKLEANFEGADEHIRNLRALAKSINANIDFADRNEIPDIAIIASRATSKKDKSVNLFLGSENWKARMSRTKPLSFGQSDNPFGASVAACIACSNVFRYIFEKELRMPLDDDIEFSTFRYSTRIDKESVDIGDVVLNDVNVVGTGAIGSACLWALSKVKSLSGNLRLIDHDKVEESNLQRYILFGEGDIGKSKVDTAANLLKRDYLEIEPVNLQWSQFVAQEQGGHCECRLLAVSIDSKEGRIEIQSSLPHTILNAYTDNSRFGISRHYNFATTPCMACLYIPNVPQRSKLDLMLEELNMKAFGNLVYQYSREGKLLDDTFLNVFCGQNGLRLADFAGYRQWTLADFYIEMVCGYKMIKIANQSGKAAEQVDVPLSFQSAMAGILLAQEIVIESMRVNQGHSSGHVSQWEVLERIDQENPAHYTYLKNQSGTCICGDEDYRAAYRAKY
jgi:hypothetical protein